MKSFDKDYTQNYTQRWTEDVFKISKIQLTIQVTYKITDYNGEKIQGRFTNRNCKRQRRTHSKSKKCYRDKEINL